MKFSEYPYSRPDYNEVSSSLKKRLDELEKCDNAGDFWAKYQEIQKIKNHVTTMATLCEIRHSINTQDEFYDKENDYWNEYTPLYRSYDVRLSQILLNYPEREKLYQYIPEVLFKLADYQKRSFSDEIIPLLQQENKLISEYGKLKATAKIELDGKTYNLSTITPLMESTSEEERIRANKAQLEFWSRNEDALDDIYDRMVKVRTEIARTLGFENYTQLAYLLMFRVDYDEKMVADYRRQIAEYIVPLADRIYQKQAARLGKKQLAFYDERLQFPDGNPSPKGEYEELIEAARKMYHEMSPETAEFIDMMIDGENWDLKSRDGKEMGGYCTGVVEQGTPFIFANFNGTSGDVDVLTHEAGHGFQYYNSRNLPVTDLQWPTNEACEIHSMTMEFNAWPWMESFFREDADRYRYVHLSSAITFLPYGALIDHFQHGVYNHPEMSREERKQCYRRLEKIYQPHKDYSEAPILKKGCWWYRQGHVFQSPFYYIDYTLAQVCALQFWIRNHHNDPDSWRDYLHLCRLGGMKSFTGLVKEAGLTVPFEDGCLKKIADEIEEYLMGIDDEAL